jgi:hypothetical protein
VRLSLRSSPSLLPFLPEGKVKESRAALTPLLVLTTIAREEGREGRREGGREDVPEAVKESRAVLTPLLVPTTI